MSNLNSVATAAQATAAGRQPASAAASQDTGHTTDGGAREPFAVLLDGILKGSQPATASAQAGHTAPDSAESPANDDNSADQAAATTPAATNPAAGLTGAAALDLVAGDAAEIPDGNAAGNPVPASGKALPSADGDAGAGTGAAVTAARDATPTTRAAADGSGLLAEVADARSLAQSMARSTPRAPPGTSGQPTAADGLQRPGPAASPAGKTAAPAALAAQPTPLPAGIVAGDAARAAATTDPGPAGLSTLAGTSAQPPAGDGSAPELPAVDLHHGRTFGSTQAAGADHGGQLLAAFAAGHAGSTGTSADAATAGFPGTPGGGAGSPSAATGMLQATPLQTALQPLGSAGAFATGLADRLLAMGGPGTQAARLKLHPDHLGAVQVEIRIAGGSAEVWFGAANDQARHAIQGSLPHLRQLFAEQGIDLARTHVGPDTHTAPSPGQGHGMAHGQAGSQHHGQGAGRNAGQDPGYPPTWATDTNYYRRAGSFGRTRHGPVALPGLAAVAGFAPGATGPAAGRVDVRV